VPHGIGVSWRECDTQSIARNLVEDGYDVLHPRVEWRGDTDGSVECEFPLYQLMIATVMAGVGEAEWPGRVINVLAMLVATFSLHRLLEARVGAAGALAGALVFLTGGHAVVLGGRVQPDATSTALVLAGLTTYLRFLVTGSGLTLLLASVATALGALAKPTGLQIGFVQFLWTVMLAPRRLRELRVWLAFGSILGIVVLWLWHSRSLFLETGLTLGVVSGGDSQKESFMHLLMPDLHLQLLRKWHEALKQADDFIADLASGSARQRLARLLLRLAHGDSAHHVMLPSREDVGAMLGITTETASRAVAAFRREGLLQGLDRQGRHFKVDIDMLQGVASRSE